MFSFVAGNYQWVIRLSDEESIYKANDPFIVLVYILIYVLVWCFIHLQYNL